MDKKPGILEKVKALKGKKGADTVIIIVIIAAIGFIYFSSYGTTGGSEEAEPTPTAKQSVQTADTEKRLAEVLSSIQGAGKVDVMITYESGTELVPAVNTETQTDTQDQESENGTESTTKSENTSSELVTVQNNGNSEAVVLRENEPKVRGVVVIAEGANDITVRMQLAQAVCTVLDVDQNSVDVFVMK